MPASFFGAVRLAGLNVGLLIIVLLFAAGLLVLVWRLLRVFIVATLLLFILPFALLARVIAPPREPKTDEERIAREHLRQATQRFLAGALQISDGGQYGRNRRLVKAIEARLADPEGPLHPISDYAPGGSRFGRFRL
jgi:hypothetical protein